MPRSALTGRTRIGFGAAEGDLIVGDWTALIVGLREDMRFDISTEGVIRDPNNASLLNVTVNGVTAAPIKLSSISNIVINTGDGDDNVTVDEANGEIETNIDFNGGAGVKVTGSNNKVGGVLAGAGNVIAFNGADGVLVSGGTGDGIRRNTISASANNPDRVTARPARCCR